MTYTLDGLQQNIDAVESLPVEVPSQLEQIIQQINAKADGHATQRPCVENLGRPTSVHAASVPSTISVIGSGSSVGKTAGGGSGVDVLPAESSDANLQRVIAQINARLESQERSRQLALQNVGAMMGMPGANHSDVYPTAAGRGVVGRSIGDQVASGLGVLGAPASRVDASSLGISPLTTVSAGLSGYTGRLAAAAAAQPKISLAAANMAAASGGYVALASGGRSAPFAIAPELVGVSSGLAGMQYPSPGPVVSASPYLRTLPGMVDAAGLAAVDPSAMVAPQQLKYIPYQSQGCDVSMVGTAAAGGLYPLQSLMPPETVGAGYTLVNSGGGAVKRSLNDVMLYMVDKRPRYY